MKNFSCQAFFGIIQIQSGRGVPAFWAGPAIVKNAPRQIFPAPKGEICVIMSVRILCVGGKRNGTDAAGQAARAGCRAAALQGAAGDPRRQGDGGRCGLPSAGSEGRVGRSPWPCGQAAVLAAAGERHKRKITQIKEIKTLTRLITATSFYNVVF